MIIDYKEIIDKDLNKFSGRIGRNEHKDFYKKGSGQHYGLLNYLANKIKGGLIIELGTHNGTGTIALAESDNNVISYDVVDRFLVKHKYSNLERRIGNIFDLKEESKLLKADFIFLDTNHSGEFELQVYEYLKRNDYKGFIIYDDIKGYEGMISFWNKVKTNKYDITKVGHSSGGWGTGLIDFSGKIKINEI